MISLPSPEEVANRADTGDPSSALSAYTAAGVFLLGTVGDVGDVSSAALGSTTAVRTELSSDSGFLRDFFSGLSVESTIYGQLFRECSRQIGYIHDDLSARKVLWGVGQSPLW